MSELQNLEDDTPAAPPAPPEPAAPVAAAPAEPEPPIDPDTADLSDDRVRSGLLGEIKRLREENKTLRPLAGQVQQLQTEMGNARPYVEFLRNNPDLLKPREQPAPQAPQTDPEAEEAARLMDFWKSDGTPDVDKGRRYLELQDRRAQKAAQQAVQPLRQQGVEAQAHAHYQQLRALKLPDGTPVRQETVDAFWRKAVAEQGGLQTLADPNSLAGVALMVLGAEAMSRTQPPKPPALPPLITEPSGGNGGPIRPLSELEKKIAANMGKSEKDWQANTTQFQRGRPQVMED